MKRMVSQFEKKAHKNQEMRIKYPEMPEKCVARFPHLQPVL